MNRSLREFGLHRYRDASISQIVSDLGIAKGSVYQYFDGKRELYLYLLEVASTRKLEALQAAALASPRDFFELYSEIVYAGAAFDFSQPRYSLLLANAMRENQTSEIGDVPSMLERRSLEFLRSYVDAARGRGELRSDLEPGIAAHSINAVTLSIGPYMEARYGFSLPSLLRDPGQTLPFDDADLRAAVQSFITVLRDGLAIPVRGGR